MNKFKKVKYFTRLLLQSITNRDILKMYICGMDRNSLSNCVNKKRLFNNTKNRILIAAMPKSGSTFLTQVLVKLTGYEGSGLWYAPINEQDLYLPKLLISTEFPNISRQHVRATDPNIELMKIFSIRPIILVRDIFDVVISLQDYFYNKTLIVPFCYLDKNFYKLDSETQRDFIIDLALPWFFNFYVSWHNAYFNKYIDEALWIQFKDLILDKTITIRKILNFYKIDKTDREIQSAIESLEKDKNKINMNKGIIGRGSKLLTKKQKEKIIELSDYYPGVDFKYIGISKIK